MGPARLREAMNDWFRVCQIMLSSGKQTTPLAHRTLHRAAGQCGGRHSEGKRLVPVSGTFRRPVLPSVEWKRAG